ncbi:MAG TPA: hypothetical protein VGD40_16710 [Chryseosolibacter sp.]
MKNENKEQKETPIRDGDTRPDQNIEGTRKKPSSSPMATAPGKVSKERAADVNSLEDFKDAKE